MLMAKEPGALPTIGLDPVPENRSREVVAVAPKRWYDILQAFNSFNILDFLPRRAILVFLITIQVIPGQHSEKRRKIFLNRLFWTGYFAYHLRGQARYPFKPLEAVKRDQARRVKAMVQYAYRHVPYYRETMNRLGLGPSDFQRAGDLAKLPILERGHLQRDPEYFVSTAQPRPRYLRHRSGGSAGAPCTIYLDAPGLLQNSAHSNREGAMVSQIVGKPFGYRQTVLQGNNGVLGAIQRVCQSQAYFPRKVRIQRQYIGLDSPFEETLQQFNEFKPDIIYAKGSHFALLLKHLEATGADFHRPKLFFYGADTLLASTRHHLKKKFNIPILSSYGSVQALKIAFECQENRGLHHNLDLYPVRIVNGNGQELPAGEKGEVIVSNLVNRGSVILNFRLGDIAAVLPDPCPCGRTLPLLTYPEGRIYDNIQLPSGRVVHPLVLCNIFWVEEEIWQYQTVQHSERHIEVRLVVADSADPQQIRTRITDKFLALLGEAVTLDVRIVDAVERTAAGKVRLVISHL
jgi:phenylacetate-CoA ligase